MNNLTNLDYDLLRAAIQEKLKSRYNLPDDIKEYMEQQNMYFDLYQKIATLQEQLNNNNGQ